MLTKDGNEYFNIYHIKNNLQCNNEILLIME